MPPEFPWLFQLNFFNLSGAPCFLVPSYLSHLLQSTERFVIAVSALSTGSASSSPKPGDPGEGPKAHVSEGGTTAPALS